MRYTSTPLGRQQRGDGHQVRYTSTPPQLSSTKEIPFPKDTGLAAQLVVPPGAWAVTHLPGGEHQRYTPGSYWLWGAPGAVLVQWVDARRQQVPVGPVEGFSADKWRVRLWLLVDVVVSDPERIADHREPLATLAAAARAAVLAYLERHSHAALTGYLREDGGMDGPAEGGGEL